MKKNNILGVFFLTFFLCLFSFSYVSAHNFGSSWEKHVGDYKIDVGYSPDILMEDVPVRFDFSILDATSHQEINFSEVWVRVEQEDLLLFAGGLGKAKFGGTGISYNFQEPNDYTISVRFSNASGTIAETEFDFNVLPKKISYWSMPIARYWIIVFMGAVTTTVIFIFTISFYFYRRAKKNNVLPKKQSKLSRFISSKNLSIFFNIIMIILSIIIGYFLTGLLLEIDTSSIIKSYLTF